MPTNPYATATPATPQLGYGQQGSAQLDSVNQWIRSRPEYQTLIRSFGQDPSNVHLNDAQKQQVVRLAQSLGVVVDEGHNGQEVDDSGNFRAKSNTLGTVLKVAGIAGLALTGLGAAGIGPLAGVFGAGSAAAEGGAAAADGTLAATQTAPLVGSLATGGTGLATAGATGAGVGTAAAAGAAGSVAKIAAGGAPSWLAPVLQGVVPAVGGIIGATIQSNANTDAAQLQAKGIADALDFEKQQYGDLTARLAPYVAAGTSSTDRMSQLLGLPARTGTTATAPPSRGPVVGAPPPQAPASPAPAATGPAPTAAPEQTITLVGPDGSTRTVPKSQADYYISKGAKPAQAAA